MFAALSPAYILAIVAILALELLVALLIYIWWKALKIQQTQLEYASRDTYQELARIVKETNEEAKKVLAKAFKTVEQLEKDTQGETEKFRKRVSQLWDMESAWQTKTHHELLDSYHKIVTQETSRVIAALEQSLTKETSILKDSLTETIDATNVEIKQQLQVKIKEAEAAIAAYEKQEVERLHEVAQGMEKSLAKQMLSRDFTPADHHQLVLKQLQQAAGTLKEQDE